MRPIDADALGIGKADRNKFNFPEYADGWNSAVLIIDEAPTLDVVPREEVDHLRHMLDSYAIQYGTVKDQHAVIDRIKAETAREIFEEIEKCLLAQEVVTEQVRVKEVGEWILHDYLPRHFAELKKKYTEENT